MGLRNIGTGYGIMANFVASVIMALWVSAIALVSVQNATPVTLRFLMFRSVQIPIGLLMGFSASIGMVGTALLLPSAHSAQGSRVDGLDEEDDL